MKLLWMVKPQMTNVTPTITIVLLAFIVLLQTCLASAQSQNNMPSTANEKAAGWKAIDIPSDPLSLGGYAWIANWSEYRIKPNVYWALLNKTDAGYAVVKVSALPFARNSLNEEIIVLDAKEKVLHPWFSKANNNLALPTSGDCFEKDMKFSPVYTFCNSAFSETSGHKRALFYNLEKLFQVKYLPTKLTVVLDGAALDALLPAAIEERRVAQLELDKISNEKKLAESTAKAREDEQKNISAANAVRALSALPRGYKDVCEYSSEGLRATGLNQPELTEMACINFGVVPGLSGLKAAGFIVTNITERSPGQRATSRFNVEKIR